MELRRPTLADQEAILEMIAEYKKLGLRMNGGVESTWERAQNYEDWLNIHRDQEVGLHLETDHVPSILFVSFDENGRALGFLGMRLTLNDFYLRLGGQIGYGIRPGEQGKGYGKQQLKLALLEAKELGLSPLLITCDRDNPASRAVILANGGVLEDVREGKERYWIDLEVSYEQSSTPGMEERGAEPRADY